MQVQVSLKIDISASASLHQIEEQIIQAGRESMRQALKQSIRAWEEQHRRCPKCRGQDIRVEGSIRRKLGALFGRVLLGLRRFRCQACLHRWCPAQGLLASLEHKQITVPLREAAVLAGAGLSVSPCGPDPRATDGSPDQCRRDTADHQCPGAATSSVPAAGG